MGTIFWDRSFRKINNSLFDIPKEVSWEDFLNGLSDFFKYFTGTPWGLTAINMNYIKVKLTTMLNLPKDLSLVSRERLDEKGSAKLSIWEWFLGTAQLTKKHLREHWKEG